ncbi:MAG: T9SS type A sorting domain-containing protein [Candidatus Latescibacteria bacterium]|nr:T9SS type A sorting domain-containing protein [Candidatus Latescibacterota bacterium]
MRIQVLGTRLTETTANVGDVINVELFIEGNGEQLVGADIFLEFEDRFLELVPFAVSPLGQVFPFARGTYMEAAGGRVGGNTTLGDNIGDGNSNNIPLFQLEYNEDIPPSSFGGSASVVGDGRLASFQLRVIRKPESQSTRVRVVRTSPTGSETGYFKLGDPGSVYGFSEITELTVGIRGLELSVSLPDIYILPGQIDSTLDLDDYVDDPANPDSTLVWTNSVPVPDSIQVGINPTSHRVLFDPRIVQGLEITNFVGITQIQFTATTFFDESVSGPLRVIVDTPPLFAQDATPDSMIYFEDRDTTFTLVAVDPDPGAQLTFSTVGTVENIRATFGTQEVVGDTIRQVVSLSSIADYFGNDVVRFSVLDQFGLADTIAVQAVVKPVNDPPRFIKAFPPIEVAALDQYMLTLSEYLEDIDDPFDRLQFAFTGVDSIAFDVTANNNTMVITPVVPFQGTRTANVVVTDTSNAAAIQRITVNVDPPKDPQPPQVTVPDLKVPVRSGAEASTIALDALVTDIDTPDDRLTWTRGPVSSVDVDASALGNRQLRVSAATDSTGYRTMTLKVADPTLLTDSLKVRVYASSVATGIPVAGGMPDIILASGQIDSLDLDDYYFDADHTNAEVTWTALGARDVAVGIDPTSHLATFQAAGSAANVVEDIVFTVRDPQGQSATDTVRVTVLDPGSVLLDLSILGENINVGLGVPDTLALRPLVQIGNPDSIAWGVNSRDPSVVFAQSIGEELLLIGVRIGSSRLVLTATDKNSGRSARDSILVNVGVQGGDPDDLILEDIGELNLTAGRDTTLDLTLVVAAGNLANLVWSVLPNGNVAVEIDTLNQRAIVRAPSDFLGNAGDLVFQAEDIATGKTASSVASVLVGRGEAPGKDLLKIEVVRNPVLKNFLDVFVRARRTLQNAPFLEVRTGDDPTVPRTVISIDPVSLVADMWVGDLRLGNETNGLVELTALGVTQDTRVALLDTLRLVIEQANVRSTFGMAHGDVAVSLPVGGVDASSAVALIPERRDVTRTKLVASDLVPVSDTYMVYAPDAEVVRSGQITFALSNTQENAGIYREDALTGKWVLVGNEIQDGRLVGEFDAFGRYGVFVDLNPVSQIELHQNFPNPFNPQTTIRFEMSDADQVELVIYNALGQEIRHLVSGYLSSGRHVVSWDARDAFGRGVSAGVYVYQLKTTQSAITRKMLLLK